MPTWNYSYMVKHMVDGEGFGDDGGEDGVKIPLPAVERKIGMIPKMKIVMVAALWIAEDSMLLGR
jgi:hypothetical protein